MAILLRWLRIPRPKTFLYVMSLRTGVEMISLSMLFNKIAGFYGLLAVLTGFKLDAMQLSLYLYSVAALILLALLMPHIRKQIPMECLALAWFYMFDTIINCAYTAAFAFAWFMTVKASSSGSQGSSAPGSGTISDAAGSTSPEYTVNIVEIVAPLATGITLGQDAAAIEFAAASANSTSVQNYEQLVDSIPSLIVIILLSLIRIYFVFIMLAYARQVIYQYMQAASSARMYLHTDSSSGPEAVNLFAPNMPQGQGWRGKLGRAMLRMGNGYFVDGFADDDWAKGLNSRFINSAATAAREPQGIVERERRKATRTKPPSPSADPTKLES